MGLLIVALVACSGGGHPSASNTPAAAPTAAGPQHDEILWDSWGIPHVYGRDDARVAYGFARAQMHSHGDLVLKLYAQARGRAAEYLGERAAPHDKWARTVGIPQHAAEWYAALEPTERAVVDAFAAGVNDYAKAHPDELKEELRAVLPVTGTDVVAHVQRMLLFRFLASPPETMGAVRKWSAGSNGWAISASRAASHHALLLANPHLPWPSGVDVFTLYEAQLVGPGLDIYGVTFVGFPFIAIGMTPELAWTHTVNTLDGADLYDLEVTKDGYVVDGAPRAFTERREAMKVRRGDGSLEDVPFTVRESIHGPIVGEKSGHALALRVAGLDAPHVLAQYMAMARAKNIDEFQAALARLQLPMFNVVYADRAGHIMEVFDGRVPRRAEGDAKMWAGVVPGTSSKLVWKDVLAYRELPRTVDPPTGWVQNANEPPWWMTMPGAPDPTKFPAYLAPRAINHYRTQRSLELVQADAHPTLDSLIADKFSTRLALADRLLDDLLPAAEKAGPLARQAAAVLAKWDRTSDAASRGGVLFAAWVKAYLGDDTFRSPGLAKPWDASAPLTTPDGLADPGKAIAALEAAAKQVTASYGALDVAWGDVHRIRSGSVDLPASGEGDDLGSFAAAWYAPEGDKLVVEGGDTYVAAIELGDTVHARAVLGYGNSSRAGSPHAIDQLPLVSQRKLRDVWRTRAEIEAHVEAKDAF